MPGFADVQGTTMGMGLIAERLAPNVMRFCEAMICPSERSHFYLVEGNVSDCLIDSGWGLGWSFSDLPRAGEKPLIAVATHSHCDHVGRFFEATTRLGHQCEAVQFASEDPVEKQAFPYLDGRKILADGGELTPASYHLPASPLSGTLADGAAIDLGGTCLEVCHTPGHSPGSLSLFDPGTGTLFCADAVHDGRIIDDIPGADRESLLTSHRRLLELDVRVVGPGHGNVLDAPSFRKHIAAYAELAFAANTE